MHNTDKKHTASQLAKIIDEVIEMHESYDNGLREMQDAVTNSMYMTGLIPDDDDDLDPEERKSTNLYLHQLIRFLRRMENILDVKEVIHA